MTFWNRRQHRRGNHIHTQEQILTDQGTAGGIAVTDGTTTVEGVTSLESDSPVVEVSAGVARLRGAVFHVERVTFDMAGLTSTEDNPPVPGIRLGTYVVPAGSVVGATVYPITEFASDPAWDAGVLFPMVRNVNGLTATPLVDAAVIGAPAASGPDDQGIAGSVDFENSMITTEDCHLGVGVYLESFGDPGGALTAGEAYIVFWIAPLEGTLP